MSAHHHTHPHPLEAHTLSETSVANPSRQQVTRRVALVGMAVNLFLTIAQVLGGIFTHSQALIADAMHTLSDLVGDIVVLFASHHAGKEADADHPYGHGRIETIATVVLGLLLGGVAVAIFSQAWGRLSGAEPLVSPAPLAMAFAALAIIGKEALYQYTNYVAKRINSPMLKASAWHHRSDALSSILVLVALGGAQLGFAWLDAVAAIIVAIMIFYMAIQLIMESTSELVDTGLSATETQRITQFLHQQDGVENVHMLRTRKMGGHIFADAHIQVASDISVSEGHHIAEQMMQKLKAEFPEIADVTVHIDPEDDETAAPCATLPTRHALLTTLQANPLTQPLWEHINQILLHYIDGKISVEVHLKQALTSNLLADFRQACDTVDAIGSVIFYQRIAS